MTQVPVSELQFSFARSGGPGGQNVNKVETKVVLHWNVGASSAFSDEQKTRIRLGLSSRLTSADEVMIAVDEERSQGQNREIAVERLNTFITQALVAPKKRRPTKPTKASKRERLETKKRTTLVKRQRKVSPIDTL